MSTRLCQFWGLLLFVSWSLASTAQAAGFRCQSHCLGVGESRAGFPMIAWVEDVEIAADEPVARVFQAIQDQCRQRLNRAGFRSAPAVLASELSVSFGRSVVSRSSFWSWELKRWERAQVSFRKAQRGTACERDEQIAPGTRIPYLGDEEWLP